VLITSSTLGTPRTITAGSVSASYCDFRDITASSAWDLSSATGGSGDCGGNSNITFTPSVPQYFYTSTTGTKYWDTASYWFLGPGGTGGAGRIPLPQDDAYFTASSFPVTGITVNQHAFPRLGRDITWSGIANAPTWTFTAAWTLYGSLTLISGLTISGTTNAVTFESQRRSGVATLTSAGKAFSTLHTVAVVGATLQLGDALSCSAGSWIVMLNGTFDASGFTVTCGLFRSRETATRSITMGSGTWYVMYPASQTIWDLNHVGLTFSGLSATIVVNGSGSTARAFSGDGLAYGTVQIATDNVTIYGNNSFASLAANVAGLTNGLKFAAGSTQTITAITTNGAAGSLAKLSSATSGTVATLTSASQQALDYVSISDLVAAGATWYAGSHSTNATSSTNSGWTWSDPVSALVLTLAATMDAPTGAGALALQLDTAVAGTLSAPTGAGALGLRLDSALAGALPAPAGAGALGLRIDSGLSSALAAPAGAGALGLTLSCAASGTVAAPIGAGALSLRLAAALAATMPAPTSAAALALRVEMAAAATCGGLSAAALLQLRLDVALAAALAAPTSAGMFLVSEAGTLQLVLAGTVAPPTGAGVLTMTLPLTVAATAYPAIAAIVAELRLPVAVAATVERAAASIAAAMRLPLTIAATSPDVHAAIVLAIISSGYVPSTLFSVTVAAPVAASRTNTVSAPTSVTSAI
jgi:hypothetical protein